MLFLSNVISLAMAQIKSGILGGIQGKVGHLSGQVSKGRNVLTIKPDMSNVVKSSSQVSNNDKFNVLRKLYLNSNETINKITCANNPYKEAGYNFFSRKNYDNLTSDNIVSVDNVFIGNSGLPRVQVLSAKYNSAHTSMTVTYSTSTFNVYGASSKTYCCLYDATNIILNCLPTSYNFFSGTFVVDLPINHNFDFNNLYVSVIASSNTDSKKFSTTLNNWILSIASVSSFNWLINPRNVPYYLSCCELFEGVDFEGIDFVSPGYYGSSNVFCYVSVDKRLFIYSSNVNNINNLNINYRVVSNGITYSMLTSCSKPIYSIPSRCVIGQCNYKITSDAITGKYLKLVFSISTSYYSISSVSVNSDFVHIIGSGDNTTFSVDANNTGAPRIATFTVTVSGDSNTYYCNVLQMHV